MSSPTHSKVIGDLLSQGRRGLRAVDDFRSGLDRRLVITILVCLVAAEVGFVGYQIGHSGGVPAPEEAAIRNQAFETSFALARGEALASSRDSGVQDGTRAGRLAGERDGTRLGTRRGTAAAEQAIAEQRAAAAARRARQAEAATAAAPAPAATPAPEPTPAATPAPSTEPADQAPQQPQQPCFDAAGHPC